MEETFFLIVYCGLVSAAVWYLYVHLSKPHLEPWQVPTPPQPSERAEKESLSSNSEESSSEDSKPQFDGETKVEETELQKAFQRYWKLFPHEKNKTYPLDSLFFPQAKKEKKKRNRYNKEIAAFVQDLFSNLGYVAQMESVCPTDKTSCDFEQSYFFSTLLDTLPACSKNSIARNLIGQIDRMKLSKKIMFTITSHRDKEKGTIILRVWNEKESNEVLKMSVDQIQHEKNEKTIENLTGILNEENTKRTIENLTRILQAQFVFMEAKIKEEKAREVLNSIIK